MGMRTTLLVTCLLLACSDQKPAPNRSAVSCGPCEARADGYERVRVRAVLRDAAGAPIAGRRLTFGAEDTGVTDRDGLAAATFAARRPGQRIVRVHLPDGTPIGAVAVVFFAGSLPRVQVSTP
jgi:hypothetical protein